MAINLCESFRAMFYTPFYLPFALGTYEAEGVDVTLSTSPSLDTVAEQLRDGIADVYWGGPMRIMVMRDRIREPEIIGFSEAITRDPFFLIGKTPNPSFDLKDLLDIRFASVSEVPTPWMCLQEDFRRAGIDPASLNRNPDRSMPENVEALANDKADVIHDGTIVSHVELYSSSRSSSRFRKIRKAVLTSHHEKTERNVFYDATTRPRNEKSGRILRQHRQSCDYVHVRQWWL